MAYLPISLSGPPQYHISGEPASGYVLKACEDGTSTPLQMATDNTGGTLVDDIVLNADGRPEVSGNEVIPHVDEGYKISLYATQAAADANTGAVWSIDNLSANVPYASSVQIDTLELGHATDTSITRPAAGRAQLEGREIVTVPASSTVLTVTLDELEFLSGTTSGSGTLTVSGFTTSETISYDYRVINDICSMHFTSFSATSNSVSFATTQVLPAAATPSVGQYCLSHVRDAGDIQLGGCYVNSNGLIGFHSDAAEGAWTTSGDKGILSVTLTYSVA